MSATSSSRIDRHRIEHRAVPAFASPRRSTGATEGRHAGASPRSTLMDQLAERALELDLDDDARRLRMHAANTPQIGAPHTTPSPDIGNELARFSPTSTASEPPAAAAAQPGIESEPPAAPVHAAIEPNWSVRSATPEAPAAFHAAALESQLHGTSLAARDLAALVNDALLEQARRHGVDMS